MALTSVVVWSQLEDSNGRQWVMPASSARSGLPRKLHGQERQNWRKDADLASRHIVFLPGSLSSTSPVRSALPKMEAAVRSCVLPASVGLSTSVTPLFPSLGKPPTLPYLPF